MRWLYHALVRGAPLPDTYAPASLAAEGFLHASYRDAVAESVRRYMPAGAAIDVLRIDPRRLEARVDVADTPRGPMPHVYGPIPKDAIAEVIAFDTFERDVATLPDRVTGTRCGFVAFEGMTLLDLVAVYDPVSRIAQMGFDPTSTCEIVCAHAASAWSHSGAELVIDRVRPPLTEFDVVVLPGGPGARVLEHDPSLVAWLSAYPNNRLKASVCTGALLWGAAGRLSGRRATTHHAWTQRLADFGATLAPGRVVDDGQLVTAGGVTCGIDLGLYLVRRLEGPDAERQIAAQMAWPLAPA
jgi:cyclohexyl-isocyanide hydratase